MNKQRVLILGTDDVLGRRVAETLAASDWASPVALKAEGVDWGTMPIATVDGTTTDGEALARAASNVDGIVVAVSGSPAVIRARAKSIFAHGGTLSQRIVHVSSMTVYGDATGTIDESAPIGSALSPYAQARVDSEEMARAHPNVVTLRPGCEYGPYCVPWSGRVARWLLARRLGDLGARGDGICNLVYIDDVVSAVSVALRIDSLAGQTFNLAMPSPPTWNEYFIEFAKVLGAVPVRRISKRRLQIETKLLAPPLKIIEIVARQLGVGALPPPIPPSATAVFTQQIELIATQATQQLETAWTPVDVGLRKTVQWVLSSEPKPGSSQA